MWIDIEGLHNLRDLGGTRTSSGGRIREGALWRSDQLTDLDTSGRAALVRLGLSDVLDLRSSFEVEHHRSPFADFGGVNYHHHSYFVEQDTAESLEERALPWLGQVFTGVHDDPVVASYLSFITDRPDSVIAALRVISSADGAALVHCAAGKDRTGITVALALSIVGVDDAVIAADYALTTERIGRVVGAMMKHSAYANSRSRDLPLEALRARPEVILAFLGGLRDAAGGVEQALCSIGWEAADTQRLRQRLLA